MQPPWKIQYKSGRDKSQAQTGLQLAELVQLWKEPQTPKRQNQRQEFTWQETRTFKKIGLYLYNWMEVQNNLFFFFADICSTVYSQLPSTKLSDWPALTPPSWQGLN